MGVQEMKQALREGHEVIAHGEFLGCVLAKGDPDLLELYLDSDPTVPDRMHSWSGVTYPRSPALVRRLLDRGLDPNRPDWLGKTFLHACAENGDRSVSAVFLDAGADINAREVEFQGTPLAAAVRSCCEAVDPRQAQRLRRMIEFLLKRGAATNLPDDEPWATPLAWATRRGHGNLVELLRQHGAT
jgi:ankyrin repeat protein